MSLVLMSMSVIKIHAIKTQIALIALVLTLVPVEMDSIPMEESVLISTSALSTNAHLMQTVSILSAPIAVRRAMLATV